MFSLALKVSRLSSFKACIKNVKKKKRRSKAAESPDVKRDGNNAVGALKAVAKASRHAGVPKLPVSFRRDTQRLGGGTVEHSRGKNKQLGAGSWELFIFAPVASRLCVLTT